jgi:hypothetical protein
MKRLLPFALLIPLTACGSKSPSTPTETIAQYGGTWTGTYSITGCTQTGGIALANICGALGQTPPYRMSLTQSSRNVSGTFTLGSVAFPQTGGTVGTDTSLQLNGTSISNGITIVVSWNLRNSANQMTGNISQQWASDTLSGGATVTGTINTAIHSQALLHSIAPPAGLTITELARLMAR